MGKREKIRDLVNFQNETLDPSNHTELQNG